MRRRWHMTVAYSAAWLRAEEEKSRLYAEAMWRPPLFVGPLPELPRGRVYWAILCMHCRGWHPAHEVELCMAVPERRATIEGTASSSSIASVGKLLSDYPEVWDFLTASQTPSGRQREPGRLSLSYESGQLRLSLTDPHSGLYASLNGSTLEELLLAFEVGLASGKLPWRPSSYGQSKPKRKG
jgi:hypothetical protein